MVNYFLYIVNTFHLSEYAYLSIYSDKSIKIAEY